MAILLQAGAVATIRGADLNPRPVIGNRPRSVKANASTFFLEGQQQVGTCG
jgi:hypothetical protein